MIPNWTNNLKSDEEKVRFRKYMYSSRGVLDRLLEMTKEMDQSLTNQEIDPDVYDSPSWAARQAHTNGYRSCLRNIQKLLTLDQKDKTNGGQPI
jgi:hypothetical protein